MSVVVKDATSYADAHIDTKLSPDSIIQTEAPDGVWNEHVSQGVDGRIIRFVYQRGGSARQVGDFGNYELINNEIVTETLVYLVTMAAENVAFEHLEPGATRIKQLLHRSSGPNVLSCRYLGPHKERVPLDGGLWSSELGGYYEITVQPT